MTVAGTSNLHDWEIDVEDMQGTLKLNQEDGVVKAVQELNLEIPVESLKSGKSGMDKNTYKALDSKKHATITYRLKAVENLKQTAADTYAIQTTGSLSISGVTKTVAIPLKMKVSNKGLLLSGSYELLMSSYKIDPPTALFGTIKTGDELQITFKTAFINQSL